jgi:hypothetical protein
MGVRTLPVWCLGALVLFSAIVRAPFVGDDLESILWASHGPTTAWLTDLGVRDQVRPLTWLSYWIEHGIFGTSSTGYHLVGLGLHGLNAWLVSRVAARVAGDRWPWFPLLAGVAFLVSPAHVEPVAWIAARADLLVTTASLLAVLAWLRFRAGGGRWGWVTLAMVVVALHTKEPAVALPLVLLVLDVVLPGRRPDLSPRARAGWLGAMVAIAAGHLLRIRLFDPAYADDQAGAIVDDGPVALAGRGVQVLARAVLPAMPRAAWLVAAVLFGVAAVVVVLVGVSPARRVRWAGALPPADARAVAALVLCAVVAVAPVARFGVSLTSQAGERFSYLPSAFAIPALVLLALSVARRVAPTERRTRPLRHVALLGAAVGVVAVAVLVHGVSVHGRAASISGQLIEGQEAWPRDTSVLALGVPDQMAGVWVNRYAFAPGLVLLHGWEEPAAYGEAAAYASGLDAPTVDVQRLDCPGCVRLVLGGPAARWVLPGPGDDVAGFLGPGVRVEVVDERTIDIEIGPEVRFERFVVASDGEWIDVELP